MWEAIAIFFTIASGTIAVLSFFGIRSIEDVFGRPFRRDSPQPATSRHAQGGASRPVEPAYPQPQRQPVLRSPIERPADTLTVRRTDKAKVEPGHLVLGFIAAALSVLIVHEGIIYLLNSAGYIPVRGWSMTPAIPPYGVPRLVNNVFWGGLWGILFALLYQWIPGGMAWLKGLIFGLFIAVVSNWILLPLIKGQVFGQPNQVLFGGWNTTRMWIVVVIVGGFGLGLGIIYGLIARDRTA